MRVPALALALAGLAACGPEQDRDAGPDVRLRMDVDRPEVVPHPRVLASGMDMPKGLVRVGTDLYVAESGGGRILRVPAAGGMPQVVAMGLMTPYGLATDGTALFVTERTGGRVQRVSLSGAVAPLASGQDRPGRVQVIDGFVYWLAEGSMAGTGALRRVRAEGGAVADLATGLRTPHDLVLAHDRVYYTETGGPERIASVPLAGGTPLTYSTDYPVVGLTLDEATRELFWTTHHRRGINGGMLFRGSVNGGTPRALTYVPHGADRVELTAQDVYWTSNAGIGRVARTGGVAYVNVAVETAAGDLLLGGDGVLYWTDGVRGLLLASP